MQSLYKLKDMLHKELGEYGEKNDLTAGTLDVVDKLSHSLKSIETIIAMEEAGDYSGNDMSGRYYDRSGARGRGRYAKRDSMGRYASRGSYADGSYGRPYYGGSYDDGMMMDDRM